MSAYLLMAVGLVSRKLAERAVYFEIILIFLGGVIGTGHHLYWAGGPSMWVPMGSMRPLFSRFLGGAYAVFPAPTDAT